MDLNRSIISLAAAVTFSASLPACLVVKTSEIDPATSEDLQSDALIIDNDFIDPRDNQIYPLVTIGSTRWFGRNLSYATAGSYCYDDRDANCAAHGRLYTFAAAIAACPPGTHLPADLEWKMLEASLGMRSADLHLEGHDQPRGTDEGAQLKANGSSGFNALMAGYRDGATYDARGASAHLWTSTSFGEQPYKRVISEGSPMIYRVYDSGEKMAISVRCVVD